MCQNPQPTGEQGSADIKRTHHMKASPPVCHIFTHGLPKQEDRDRTQGHDHQDLLHNTLYEGHKQLLKACVGFSLAQIYNYDYNHQLIKTSVWIWTLHTPVLYTVVDSERFP